MHTKSVKENWQWQFLKRDILRRIISVRQCAFREVAQNSRKIKGIIRDFKKYYKRGEKKMVFNLKIRRLRKNAILKEKWRAAINVLGKQWYPYQFNL